MQRFVAIGILIGVSIGVLLYFLFPSILFQEIAFVKQANQQMGLPLTTVKGSRLIQGLLPLFLGGIGGGIGAGIYKLKKLF